MIEAWLAAQPDAAAEAMPSPGPAKISDGHILGFRRMHHRMPKPRQLPPGAASTCPLDVAPLRDVHAGDRAGRAIT
ncbi:hypothetical protein [Mangrovicoccus sp. HB161399]|uniref:hypothetical protein n=1 Tax=Mangrovicoccus sp. HB161399 TaxID=2720392 RepID=UPI0015564ECA|nr:hypothetical protein [Mangrovicoccus sp. HB161399]